MSAPWWWAEGAADGADRYDGPHATRRDAIDAARREVDPFEVFTIMEARMLDDSDQLADVTCHEELRA